MKNNMALKGTLLFVCLLFLGNLDAQQNCRVDSIYSYTHNDAQKTKTLTAKTYITYDADGNKTELIKSFLDVKSNIWKLNLWEKYTYTDGRLSFWQFFGRDQANQNWVEAMRIYTLYNNNGQVSDFYGSRYEGGSWMNNFYDKTLYDAQGRKLIRVTSYWNPEDHKWFLYTRDSSLYDIDNRETQIITAFQVNEQWLDNHIQNFSYDSDGQISESFYYMNSNGKWELNRKYAYTYYNGLLSKKTASAQRLDNKDWYDLERTVNTYTSDGCLDNSHYYFFDYSSNTWTTHTQDQYVFPVYDPQTNPLTVYPNPAGILSLHFLAAIKTSYTLFDMNGQNVMEGVALPGDNEVGVQHLSAGIYVLRSGSHSQMVLLR